MILKVAFKNEDSIKGLQELLNNYPNIKTAWYTGLSEIPNINLDYFDYIKIGAYIKDLGGLKSPTTNQRLYKIEDKKLEDITYKFWK